MIIKCGVEFIKYRELSRKNFVGRGAMSRKDYGNSQNFMLDNKSTLAICGQRERAEMSPRMSVCLGSDGHDVQRSPD